MIDTFNLLLRFLHAIWNFVGHLSALDFLCGILLLIFCVRFPSFKQWIKNKIKPSLHKLYRLGVKQRRQKILSIAIIQVRNNPKLLAFVLNELRWEWIRNEKTNKEYYRNIKKKHWAIYPFDYFGLSLKEKAGFIHNYNNLNLIELNERWLEVVQRTTKNKNSRPYQFVRVNGANFRVEHLEAEDFLVTDTHYEWEDVKEIDKKLYYKLILWVFAKNQIWGENRKFENGLKKLWEEWGKRE